MKQLLIAFTALLFACSNEKTTPEASIFKKDYYTEHPDWIKVSDGSKDFQFGFEGIEVPIHVAWTTYKDPAGCLQVGSLDVVRKESPAAIKITNVRDSYIPCASVFESEDTTRFSQRIVLVKYEAQKGRVYEYGGELFDINGKGEIKPKELKEN